MRALMVVLTSSALLAGCATSAAPDLAAQGREASQELPSAGPGDSASPPEQPPPQEAAPGIPQGVDPEAVVQAAVALASGAAEEAVAAGLLLPEEVEAAATALENGTLDLYIAAAEDARRSD